VVVVVFRWVVVPVYGFAAEVVVVVVASVLVAGDGSTTVVQEGRIGIAMSAVAMAMVFVFMVVAGLW
jgi:hypothetical protein